MYMYQNAFLYNRVGYAAAIATVLAIAIFVLAAIVLRIGDRDERAMTAGRLDRIGTYVVLCAFALLALYPVLSILFLALHTEDRPRHGLRRSRRGSTSRASRRRGPRATSRPASSRASSSRAP